ncbi:MAG: 6,7-dimethyl-8-ribityllumazine synthase [Hyphomicrobiaceae bacterium]
MATTLKSTGMGMPLVGLGGARVLIIEARYYEGISDALVQGAIEVLEEAGVEYDRIAVPGALEIPQALLAACDEDDEEYDGAIALGCVIRGETSHYETVCNNANHWLMHVAIDLGLPVGNAILTVENEEQAWARARGGKAGKGGDAARACLALVEITQRYAGIG